MVKAVFLDFDYTIYSHKTTCIPASAKRAILALKEKGVKVFLATGRNTAELDIFPEYKELHFDGFIMLNGQVCLDGEYKTVFKKSFDSQSLKALVDLFNSKTQPIVFIEENDNYINYTDPIVTLANGEIGCLDHKAKPYSGNPVYLAVAYIKKDEEAELLSKLPGCCLKRWGDNGVDIVCEGTDKAESIKKYLDILGIRPEETLAIGDSYNDIDMIKNAGIGIAMGNSIKELKDVADYTTTDIDDNGLENALRHYGLI